MFLTSKQHLRNKSYRIKKKMNLFHVTRETVTQYSLNIVCSSYVYVICMVTAERGNFVVSLVPEIL